MRCLFFLFSAHFLITKTVLNDTLHACLSTCMGHLFTLFVHANRISGVNAWATFAGSGICPQSGQRVVEGAAGMCKY